MNLVCLPGQPCDQVIHAIAFIGGGLRPLTEIRNKNQECEAKVIGIALCNGRELVFLNRCPFCGADLYVPMFEKCPM